MAVVIEGISVVVPIGLLDIAPGAPPAFRGAGAWHDGQLYCETVLPPGEAGLWVDPAARRGWEEFAAKSARARWKVFCVASSGLGLAGDCLWAQYDPATDAVWCTAYPKGEAFGGKLQFTRLQRQMAASRAAAEASYDRMYDSRRPRDDRDDALDFLSEVIRLARLLGDAATLDEARARQEHISAVYRSQFRL